MSIIMDFWNGGYTPHPNSLMFNVYPIFWPFKVFWFFRKVPPTHPLCLTLSFRVCVVHADSVFAGLPDPAPRPPRRADLTRLLPPAQPLRRQALISPHTSTAGAR